MHAIDRIGTIVGFSKDLNHPRVHWDGTSPTTVYSYHPDLIEALMQSASDPEVGKGRSADDSGATCQPLPAGAMAARLSDLGWLVNKAGQDPEDQIIEN